MSLLAIIFKPIDALLSRIAAAVGALILVQFPNFVVQYMQRLGGHLDELRRIVAQYQQAADATGKTLEAYIEIHKSSGSPEIVKTGEIIRESVNRYLDLQGSFDAITNAPSTMKFFAFIKNADWEIAKNTLSNYTPGLSLNNEGLLYALAGVLAASFIYFIIKTLLTYAFHRIAPENRIKSDSSW